jgi:hypothetical protein
LVIAAGDGELGAAEAAADGDVPGAPVAEGEGDAAVLQAATASATATQIAASRLGDGLIVSLLHRSFCGGIRHRCGA